MSVETLLSEVTSTLSLRPVIEAADQLYYRDQRVLSDIKPETSGQFNQGGQGKQANKGGRSRQNSHGNQGGQGGRSRQNSRKFEKNLTKKSTNSLFFRWQQRS